MSRTRICSATALLLFSMTTAVAQTPSRVFHANGAFASGGTCTVSGSTIFCIFLFVSRGGPVTAPTTFLFYDLFAENPTLGTFEVHFGSGTIPNSAFKIKGITASLNVDTSTVPGFTNGFCNSSTCAAAPGGPVTGAWTEFTPHIGFSQSGTSSFSSPGAKFITSGTSDSNQALASVSVLGETQTNTFGNIGTQHTTSITVQTH